LTKEYTFILNAYQDSFGKLMPDRETLDVALLVNFNEKQLATLKQSEHILHDIC
jgi:hypothetical protein